LSRAGGSGLRWAHQDNQVRHLTTIVSPARSPLHPHCAASQRSTLLRRVMESRLVKHAKSCCCNLPTTSIASTCACITAPRVHRCLVDGLTPEAMLARWDSSARAACVVTQQCHLSRYVVPGGPCRGGDHVANAGHGRCLQLCLLVQRSDAQAGCIGGGAWGGSSIWLCSHTH
jgi:hypothetical protein